MMAVVRLILTALLLFWVYSGSRIALVLTLTLMAMANELLAWQVKQAK